MTSRLETLLLSACGELFDVSIALESLAELEDDEDKLAWLPTYIRILLGQEEDEHLKSLDQIVASVKEKLLSIQGEYSNVI